MTMLVVSLVWEQVDLGSYTIVLDVLVVVHFGVNKPVLQA